MRRRRGQSGFVLILVLLLLVIAGTLLAATARHSGGLALEASRRHERLQVEWGTRSARALCLSRAERILQEEAGDAPVAPVTARRAVMLGDVTFRLTVADEQAKANVNALARRRGVRGIDRPLSALQIGTAAALPIELRPRAAPPDGTEGDASVRPYASFDRLVVFASPDALRPSDGRTVCLIDRVTCWGSGRLNARKAERPVLRQMTAGVLTEEHVSKLLRFREQRPDAVLPEILSHLELEKERRAEARRILTDFTLCHSLWVVADTGSRRYYRLFVQEAGFGPGGTRIWRFRW